MSKPNPTTDPVAVGDIGLGVAPKQRRGIEVRDRLYEAAIAEFSRSGVVDSRVENIVAEAGTSWGTFFRYFPRKEDVLLMAAVKHFRELVFPPYEAGLADGTKSVRSQASEFFATLMTPRLDPRLHAEILAETTRYTARFAAMMEGGEAPVAEMLAKLMEVGQERGEVRADASPLLCGLVLSAGVIFPVTQVLQAVAIGELPGSEIKSVADRAFELAWSGIGA